MNVPEILLDETDDAAIKAPIKDGVRDYNFKYLGEWKTKPLTFYIKDAEGIIIAGALCRYISAELVDVDYFWVDKKHRGQKLGSKLMECIEIFAKRHKIHRIDLYTMDFQARGFYEKLGFALLAVIPNWARSYDAYLMRKVL